MQDPDKNVDWELLIAKARIRQRLEEIGQTKPTILGLLTPEELEKDLVRNADTPR